MHVQVSRTRKASALGKKTGKFAIGIYVEDEIVPGEMSLHGEVDG